MKPETQNIETPEQLAAQVKELKAKLAECLGDGEHDDKMPPRAMIQLWKSVSRRMNYSMEYLSTSSDITANVYDDLAKLGRISQEVTFAHLCRNSSSDFGVSRGSGDALTDGQYEDLVFFLDRLSSTLHAIHDEVRTLRANKEIE